jgi:hypothetical protein
MSYSINPFLAVQGTIWANRGGGAAPEPLDPGLNGQVLERDINAPLGIKWGAGADQRYISPSIDLTAFSTTTILTNGATPFVVTSITFVADLITNYSGGAIANIGFVDPNYTEYFNGWGTDPAISTNLYNTVFVGSGSDTNPFLLLPAFTPLKVKVTTQATADAFIGRYIILGFNL